MNDELISRVSTSSSQPLIQNGSPASDASIKDDELKLQVPKTFKLRQEPESTLQAYLGALGHRLAHSTKFLFSSTSAAPLDRLNHADLDDEYLDDVDDEVAFHVERHDNHEPRIAASRGTLLRIPGLYTNRRPLKDATAVAADSSDYPSDWRGVRGRRVAADNFTTIDWIHDLTLERMRLVSLRSLVGWRGFFARAFDSSQAWIIVFSVEGLMTGLIAGYIDVGSMWLSDIKDGYCSAGVYLNRKFCCWHRSENDVCSEWKPWSTVVGATSSYTHWLVSCLVYSLFAVAFATTGSFLVKCLAPYAAGEGVPEIKTILGGFVIRKFLGGWTLLVKVVGLVLSVGSGLSLGKEGPLVHISCCLGNIIPKIFKKYSTNEAKKREILSASSAAGISVAFGAPIGGVLFSLEEVSYYFPSKTMWRSFFCAMVGAIALRVINPFRSGKLVWFQVTYSRDWHAFELPVFILLGVLGGLAGTLFIRINLYLAKLRKETWIRHHPIAEVAVIALLTGIFGYSHVYLRITTVDLVANLFRECAEVDVDFYGLCRQEDAAVVVVLLLLGAVIKFFLTAFTFGVLIPAGIFTPSMAIGACVGRALGIIVQQLQVTFSTNPIFSSCDQNLQCITPGTYAMVGAAAFLSGTTRMTVSLTVIMFELTGALSYVLPIIITILTAKWVGDTGGKGLYYLLIRLEGYPFLDGGEEYSGSAVIGDIMTTGDHLESLTGIGFTVESLDELLQSSGYKGFPVIDNTTSLNLIGFAGRAELRYALASFRRLLNTTNATPIYFVDPPQNADPANYLDMRPWIEATPPTVPPNFPVSMCVELFKKMGSRYIIVTCEGRLKGFATKKDLLRHLNSSAPFTPHFTIPN